MNNIPEARSNYKQRFDLRTSREYSWKEGLQLSDKAIQVLGKQLDILEALVASIFAAQKHSKTHSKTPIKSLQYPQYPNLVKTNPAPEAPFGIGIYKEPYHC